MTLLDGVTGSGKTEVYFEAVAAALDAGKQVLILLPEIALTQAFLERFQDRFGAKPAEWHSDVPPRMRERVWRQVAEGRVRVVAGARSALFLPFSELGLIVVDEEHDPAYKQEDRVFYMRATWRWCAPASAASRWSSPRRRRRSKAGSTRSRAATQRVALPSRFADAAMPDIGAIDMRRAPPARGGFLSPVLLRHISENLQRGEQSLLFLNRRGYAPLTLCRACGHRFQCPDCSSWLVEHRFRGQLVCHHCGHRENRPEACPECGTLDHLVACGPGVERIAEEVVGHFPDARTIVLSSDMLGGVRRLRLELEAIAKGEADIVIGTQLVAKGHHFPDMTLVGVVDADLGLANGDPRAAERTFQLLSQVTGRAGRTGKKSIGLLQTYQPDHPVMRAIVSGDSESFYEKEIAERQAAHLPPFGRLAGIIVSAQTRAEAEAHARGLRRAAPEASDLHVLGPAEAPLALIGGRHRFRLLVQGERRADIQCFIRAMLAAGPKLRGSVQGQRRHRPAELSLICDCLESSAQASLVSSARGVWRGIDGVRISVADHARRMAGMVVGCGHHPVRADHAVPAEHRAAHPAAADGPRASGGTSEARATMSGFYLGLGLCCILLAQPLLYMALGFSWLFTAFGRIVSMLSDRGNTLYNWISLVIEAGSCGPAAGLLARLCAMMRQGLCRSATKLSETMRDSVLRSTKACARRQSTFGRGARQARMSGPQKSIRSKI